MLYLEQIYSCIFIDLLNFPGLSLTFCKRVIITTDLQQLLCLVYIDVPQFIKCVGIFVLCHEEVLDYFLSVFSSLLLWVGLSPTSPCLGEILLFYVCGFCFRSCCLLGIRSLCGPSSSLRQGNPKASVPSLLQSVKLKLSKD